MVKILLHILWNNRIFYGPESEAGRNQCLRGDRLMEMRSLRVGNSCFLHILEYLSIRCKDLGELCFNVPVNNISC